MVDLLELHYKDGKKDQTKEEKQNLTSAMAYLKDVAQTYYNNIAPKDSETHSETIRLAKYRLGNLIHNVLKPFYKEAINEEISTHDFEKELKLARNFANLKNKANTVVTLFRR